MMVVSLLSFVSLCMCVYIIQLVLRDFESNSRGGGGGGGTGDASASACRSGRAGKQVEFVTQMLH